ncbi:MAG TPA: two-component system response regulator [Burkholderiaceae bacterium]|nr:two-component system response regulator [Burkholderiaceae bacterium]HMX11049.1 two-component system response regulator [Burkholderiaceae bacterium]HMY99838.1 two-component system response regulator [Burkholderiaceae bacterium]HNG79684.1 two-component system response regulator [Burkholderiaceae bacterium]
MTDTAPMPDGLMAAPPLPTLLVVDDTPANLSLMAGLLHQEYRVKLANSGPRALELAQREPPDLILLDVMMPELDGYAVCRLLKRDPRTRDVPVIFVTAMSQPEDETRGFECGAVDFIHKPISPPIVRARVRTHLQLKTWQDSLRRRSTGLEVALRQRLEEVERLRDTTLFVMVSLAEFRDEDTGNHVKRTQEYVRALAEHLAEQPDCMPGRTEPLDPSTIELIAKSAPLHDIGKVAIPDHILLKPGPLTADEFAEMRKHPLHGWEMLRRAAQRMGGEQGFLSFAMQIARHHHERWDGSGYPDRLAGRDIPLAARLMAVADVYDALISRRPYKEPYPHEDAVQRITAEAGRHFDPDVVRAMLAQQDRFIAIAATWCD